MSHQLAKTQTRIRVEGANPMIIRTKAADDDVLQVLANERRRQILAAICEAPGAVCVSRLAERVSDRVASSPSTSAADVSTDRLQVALYHQHLPKFEEAGLIEYDTENRTVRKTDAVEV